MARSEMVTVEIGGVGFRCTVCGGERFYYREIKMNTTGASFMGFDWANASSDAAVCVNCDYVHQFYGPNHKLYQA